MSDLGSKIVSVRQERTNEIGKIKANLYQKVRDFAVSKQYRDAVVEILGMNYDYSKVASDPSHFFSKNELKQEGVKEFVDGCGTISETIHFYNQKVREIEGYKEELLERQEEKLNTDAKKFIQIQEQKAQLEKGIALRQKRIRGIKGEKEVQEAQEEPKKTHLERISEETISQNGSVSNAKAVIAKLTREQILEDLEGNEDFQGMAGITIDTQNKVLDLSGVRNPNNKVLKFKGFYLFPIFRKLAREIGFDIPEHIPTKKDVADILKKVYEEKGYTIINNTQRRAKKIGVDKDVIIANFGDEFQKFVRGKVILKHGEYTPEGEREYLLNFEKISDEVFLEFIREKLHESDRADLKKLFPEPTDADLLGFIACLIQDRTRVLNGDKQG